MKTLEEIKNEVALDHGHKNFHYWGLSENGYREGAAAFDEISKRYAIEAIKSDRVRVADNAKTTISPNPRYDKKNNSIPGVITVVDKQSILNLQIELK